MMYYLAFMYNLFVFIIFVFFFFFLLFFIFFFFFFFQAEDGIRDRTVTGVQTCALPILRSGCFPRSYMRRLNKRLLRRMRGAPHETLLTEPGFESSISRNDAALS